MAKTKRQLKSARRRSKRERKRKYMTIFIHGRQKRIPRPPTIDGLPVDDFIRRNADPIWLHQNEIWECLEFLDDCRQTSDGSRPADDVR